MAEPLCTRRDQNISRFVSETGQCNSVQSQYDGNKDNGRGFKLFHLADKALVIRRFAVVNVQKEKKKKKL